MNHVKNGFSGRDSAGGHCARRVRAGKGPGSAVRRLCRDRSQLRDPNYVDPNYDPNYAQDYAQNYQDPAYDPNYGQGYQDPATTRTTIRATTSSTTTTTRATLTTTTTATRTTTTPRPTPRLYDPFYDPYCDYYTPPWGYPLDYCRYQTWNQPVYYGGLWYSGPIYHRIVSGVPWYWLNGRWCRDEWRGARPSYIDWGRNKRWNGNRHNWRDEYRRGNWAGRDTWVGRNYRDNFREARSNVLDRARDRNFRQEFVRNIRDRDGDVAGGVRGRNGDRPGFNNNGRARDNALRPARSARRRQQSWSVPTTAGRT